jgi:hypothetical protein
MEITTIGLDIAKRVFQVHGADASGKAVLRRKLQRDQVLKPRRHTSNDNVQNLSHFWDFRLLLGRRSEQ